MKALTFVCAVSRVVRRRHGREWRRRLALARGGGGAGEASISGDALCVVRVLGESAILGRTATVRRKVPAPPGQAKSQPILDRVKRHCEAESTTVHGPSVFLPYS